MRTLVTTSRMPFAVDEIRKLGEAGHDVTAVDTFKASPGSHSRYAARHLEVPQPTQQTEAFIDAIVGIIADQQIEWVLPMFEEVFYLAAHRDRLEGSAELFFPDFDTLAKVHDKVSFAAICRDLGLPVAESVTATSPQELKDAIGRFDHWFARAAYGRGGLNVLTNTGPLAGEGSLEDAVPSPDDPWLVQEYLQGVDLCSWSVVHHGEVVLHSTYEHALTIDNRGGIVFESVDAPETLATARKIAAELGWNGQVSFDFLRTDDGVHHLVECNPRPTDGCTLATADEFSDALFGPKPSTPVVIPAGRKREIKEAVIRDMFQHMDRFRSDAKAAKGGKDVYAGHHDHLPLLYTVLSLQHVKAYRKTMGIDHKTRQDLTAAQFFDVAWDGEAISVTLAIVLSLLAALLFALASVLQQRGTSDISDDDALGANMITALARRPIWLLGITADVAGFGVQAAALAVGSLLLVQPLLVTTLLFALPLAARFAHRRLTEREWLWSGLLVVSLVVFVIMGEPTAGRDDPSFRSWLPTIVIVVPLVAACIYAASGLPHGTRRSLVLAVAAGVLLGVSAPLTKTAIANFDQGIWEGLKSWELWGMALAAALGTFWQQSSYQAGDVQTSLPAVTVLKPLVAMALGLTIYEEKLKIGGVGDLFLLASIVSMVMATVVLGRLAAPEDAEAPPPDAAAPA